MKHFLIPLIIGLISFVYLFPNSLLSQERGGKRVLKKSSINPSLITGNPSYRALLIGNNDYLYWPKLKTAVKDVEILGKIFIEEYGFLPQNVRIVKNADRRTMLKEMEYLVKTSQSNDNVLIYYGGHGEYDDSGQGYWIPIDGKAEDSFDYISNGQILEKLRAIKAKHKFLISDSCFSGNLMSRSRGFVRSMNQSSTSYYKEKSNLISVQGLSSGGNEPVSDGGKRWGGHSIFAFHLIAQLKANQRPYLSANELGEKIVRTVARDTASYLGTGAKQTPLINRINDQLDQEGEFFFLKPFEATPIMVVYQKSENEQFNQLAQQAQQVLQNKLIEGIENADIGVVISPQVFSIDPYDQLNQLKILMTTQKIDVALVYSLIGEIKRTKESIMWQGISELNTSLSAYQLINGRLKLIPAPKIPTQKYPIRTWNNDRVAQKRHLAKNAAKVARKWPKRQLNKFFETLIVR